MKKLHYNIQISAAVTKVYKTMLDPEGFKQWSAIFQPSSRYEGSWKKGSKIRFLVEHENEGQCGMASIIRENILNEFVSIEHKAQIVNGIEISSGETAEAFAGCLEEYTFKAMETGTHLKVSTDTLPEWEAYFEETWPKALERLKEICES